MSTSRTAVGSQQERGALFASLYAELRRIARRELRRRSGGVSLSATTLLHEAYLKLKHADWNDYTRELTEWERRTTLDC